MSSWGWQRARKVAGSAVLAALLVGAAACSDDDEGGGDAGPQTTSGADAGGGEVVGSGDTYEATIHRTTDGVPHITGATIADVTFGQGWASGEDRACDLADQIVKIRGERSRFFGPGDDGEHLDSDVMWRSIGIFELASSDFPNASAELTEQLTAFADGWNAHLAEVGPDGIEAWCAGAEWLRPVEPVEIYAYARSIALQASGSRVGEFIPSAAPPGSAEAGDAAGDESAAADLSTLVDAPSASNGWAVGAERSADGGGLLVGNPHFPWEGELRFWEVHLSVPGELDAYGVQLSGLPGIGIGFTDDFAWTHTVSAGNRFTAYRLDLVPGSPTSYRYGDETRDMVPTEHEIEVLGDDGELETVTRTTWRSHYGPIIDFPGFGWTDAATITYRDANIDNDEFLEQYLAMVTAEDLDEFIAVHQELNGVPLFNTVATSADGRAWYADTSATPNLSPEAIALYDQSVVDDPIVAIAADNGAVLLNGSDPRFEWVEEPGARDPGLVPAARQPQVERADYVFNANDSFWVSHATELLAGDYSPLHGRQETPRSPRTRENAVVLDDATPAGASGEDGRFTLDELADAAVANRGYVARALLDDVVARCQGVDTVTVQEVPADGDRQGLPAGTVDITGACEVLAGWDGVYDLDRAGPVVWRELIAGYSSDDLRDAGDLWAEPFDPARPIETPAGLAAPLDPADDPVLTHLAEAVQTLEIAGIPVDAPLGDVQFALRAGQRIPIHGGTDAEGVTNVVRFGSGESILDPALDETEREPLVVGSTVAGFGGEVGYPVTNGTSFLLAVAFGPDGPRAKAFLTYANTSDRSAEDYTAATERFSAKDWRDVLLAPEDIEAAAEETLTVRG